MAIVRLYASLRKAAGEREFDSHGLTVKEVLEDGKRRFSSSFSEQLGSCTVLVNGKNVALLKGKRTKVKPEDVVSLFPPMAGG